LIAGKKQRKDINRSRILYQEPSIEKARVMSSQTTPELPVVTTANTKKEML
jgi:hypothetical protein